ncbi:hypothetical protein AGDE_02042 [Angomonas deanei]|nr:hypothetical protein AGDE_02042 [Angomonas deanei]|eukprot:EPY41881.1 hypothetical protein AGDE_02042 [Angomonas deanei]
MVCSLAVPTFIVAGYVASRKRLAYQWIEELLDPEGNHYPTLTDGDMVYVRRVAPAEPTNEDYLGTQLPLKENFGLHVRTEALRPEVCNVLLNEVRDWAESLGNNLDERKAFVFTNLLERLNEMLHNDPELGIYQKVLSKDELDPSFYGRQKIISDHAEDIQMMRAPWGCGDAIDFSKMPSSLRYLVDLTQGSLESLGRLRHVCIEYSPTGKFYRDPKSPKHYDGHDCVIIPLRRDEKHTVITFSPVFRSKQSFLPEVMRYSWTSKDVDCLVPQGAMLRFYGSARYDWGWGVRPGRVWFGGRPNMVQMDHFSLSERLLKYLRTKGERAQPRPSDAALVTLHFEGPSRSKKRQRSRLIEPEMLVFGRKPTPELFEQWGDDRPTAEAVKEEGLFRFLVRNYKNMLLAS